MSQTIDQAETLRRQAIGLLVAERQDIDRKLAQLGADGAECGEPTKPKMCGVCGSSEHNARFHKSRGSRGEEAIAAIQGTVAQPHA
jgi:hypothetical protein